MNHRWLFRIGAIAAVTGALAQVAATVLEPGRSDVPGEAIRAALSSGIWTFDQLLDLIGFFLVIGALAVAGRMFAGGPGMDWSRAGMSFLAMPGALGASAVVTGAVLKHVADARATAGTTGVVVACAPSQSQDLTVGLPRKAGPSMTDQASARPTVWR